jgi:hypothetical protein
MRPRVAILIKEAGIKVPPLDAPYVPYDTNPAAAKTTTPTTPAAATPQATTPTPVSTEPVAGLVPAASMPSRPPTPVPSNSGAASPSGKSNTDIWALATKGETGRASGNPGIVNEKGAASDAGGYSYGSFQIATKTGTFDTFMQYAKNEDPGVYARLMKAGGSKAALAGTPGFIAEWKAIAKDDPQGFQKLQAGFIKKTHYDVQMDLLKKNGIDLSGRSDAVKNVVFTMATAEGPWSKTISQALQGKNIKDMDDKELINAIYDTKSSKLTKMYAKNGAALQAGITARWGEGGRERKDALAMLTNEPNRMGSPSPTLNAATSPQTPQLVTSASSANSGVRLTQASTEQRDLSRTLTAAPANVNTVIAPTTSTSNTTVQADVKAQNSESTYQRTMNGQYVAT